MASTPSAPAWRDWTIFAARWLMIAGFAGLVFVVRGSFAVQGETGSALLITVAANILLALVLLLRVPALHTPTFLLTDWIIVGALTWLARGNPLLTLAVAIACLLLTLFRPNALYSLLHLIGSVTVIGAVLYVNGQVTSLNAALTGDLQLPALLLAFLGIIVVFVAYSLERQAVHQRRTYGALAEMKSEQLDDIRERTRAIYEMTMTFSETQHFERILNAALDAGQLGLRGRMGRSLAAGVLLFQAEEPGLRVIAGRKFTRGDMMQLIPGKRGIVGEALREASPIIGGRAKVDEELHQLVGFHNARSTLCVPLRAGYDNFGVLIYGSEAPGAFTTEHMELLTSIGVQATIALQNHVLYQTLLEEKDRITRVAEDERKQLARQLHDGPTQKVSALAMMTSIIHKLLEKAPEQVPEELRKMEEIARSTTREMRHMLFTLRPLVLENQGLSAALDQLAEKMRETHGQNVVVRMQPEVEDLLDSNKQGVVFYLIEEAINNARKHAQASLIRVDIKRAKNNLAVQIVDNGAGFDLHEVDAGYSNRGSLGMVNMRERAALLDGNLHIESARGKGTRITLIAPLIADVPAYRQQNETIADIPIEQLKVGASRRRMGRTTEMETGVFYE